MIGVGLSIPQIAASGSAVEQGVLFDFSDFSTMFQDSAGTTPVTAVDQPVGLVLDKSGRGNHASQATTTARPVLKQDGSGFYYLLFDGTDDGLVTSAIDFGGSDKISVFAGVRKLASTVNQCVAELSSTRSSNAGAFTLFAPGSAGGTYQFLSRGSLDTGTASASGYTEPVTSVITGLGDISGDTCTLRVDGVQKAQGTANQGSGNCANKPLYIGRRGTATGPFNGRLYSLIVRGGFITAEQIAANESWVAAKTGVTL